MQGRPLDSVDAEVADGPRGMQPSLPLEVVLALETRVPGVLSPKKWCLSPQELHLSGLSGGCDFYTD